jgi:hypothetical protein
MADVAQAKGWIHTDREFVIGDGFAVAFRGSPADF